MSLAENTARGLKWNALEIGGRQILSLGLFALLARLLSPAAFGMVGLTSLYLGFLQLLAEQGMPSALVQRRDLTTEHISAAFAYCIFCSLLLSSLTIAFATPIAATLGDITIAPLLRVGCFVTILNTPTSIILATYSRELDFRRSALRTISSTAIAGAIAVGCAFGGFGVWALIIQQLCFSSISSLILWISTPWRPRFKFSIKHVYDLMQVSNLVSGTSLLWFFSTRVDQLILGRTLSISSLGHYMVAVRFNDLAKTALYQPMGAVSLPALSRLQHNSERFQNALLRTMRFTSFLSFPCLVGLSAVAQDLVPLLLGPQWLPSGPLLSILALYLLVSGLQGLSHYAIIASGAPRHYLLIILLHTCGSALACFIGSRFGSTGVAYSLLINEIVMAAPRLYALQKWTGVGPILYYRTAIEPGAAAIVMYLALQLSHSMLQTLHPILHLVTAVTLGTIIYITTLFLISRDCLNDVTSVILTRLKPSSQL